MEQQLGRKKCLKNSLDRNDEKNVDKQYSKEGQLANPKSIQACKCRSPVFARKKSAGPVFRSIVIINQGHRKWKRLENTSGGFHCKYIKCHICQTTFISFSNIAFFLYRKLHGEPKNKSFPGRHEAEKGNCSFDSNVQWRSVAELYPANLSTRNIAATDTESS